MNQKVRLDLIDFTSHLPNRQTHICFLKFKKMAIKYQNLSLVHTQLKVEKIFKSGMYNGGMICLEVMHGEDKKLENYPQAFEINLRRKKVQGFQAKSHINTFVLIGFPAMLGNWNSPHFLCAITRPNIMQYKK